MFPHNSETPLPTPDSNHVWSYVIISTCGCPVHLLHTTNLLADNAFSDHHQTVCTLLLVLIWYWNKDRFYDGLVGKSVRHPEILYRRQSQVSAIDPLVKLLRAVLLLLPGITEVTSTFTVCFWKSSLLDTLFRLPPLENQVPQTISLVALSSLKAVQ